MDANETLDEIIDQEIESIEETIAMEDIKPALKLDYTLKTMEERSALVDKIIQQTPSPQLTPRYLEILTDYIMNALTKEERKEKRFLTDNRMITINKRETSFEGLVEKFENGEDGVYNLISDNNKHIILTPKVSITEQDIAEVPGLKDLRAAIDSVDAMAKAATGKRKYLLKKQVIEMRKDQYILKNSYRAPMNITPTPCKFNRLDLEEERWIDENNEPQSKGLITFFNPKHISAILCNYEGLKNQVKGRYWDDLYYLMEDFDKLMNKTLINYPLFQDLVKLKIDGKSNLEIQEELYKKHGVKHSIEYISQLWRSKIPKVISEQEKEDYLIWYFTYVEPERAVWKKCSCCGQNKLAHNRFFSKNSTSKSGYYSQCKRCRNNKNKKGVN